ncbi:aminotransferase class I and II domain-containing protein [Ditylenchus destructor]|uniref:Aminotransferase class I and II domain-containing protein n=1 Tax=Ditylenchus destructor TaxID=166010 RepID=A0AAD4N8D7_9BILA|nr:aminotransferase class I and II domain-containing protein [Ditylenchus destructor]
MWGRPYRGIETETYTSKAARQKHTSQNRQQLHHHLLQDEKSTQSYNNSTIPDRPSIDDFHFSSHLSVEEHTNVPPGSKLNTNQIGHSPHFANTEAAEQSFFPIWKKHNCYDQHNVTEVPEFAEHNCLTQPSVTIDSKIQSSVPSYQNTNRTPEPITKSMLTGISESKGNSPSLLSVRGRRLFEDREIESTIYEEVAKDKWHGINNSQGRIDLCNAESNICCDLITQKLPKYGTKARKASKAANTSKAITEFTQNKVTPSNTDRQNVTLNTKKVDQMDVIHVAKQIMPDVDETIFDEVSTLNTILEQILDEEFEKLSTEEKWKKIFKSDLPSLYQLVSKILSVPVSNAFVERIFSLVSAQWTDTRNSLKEETVKSLVQVLDTSTLWSHTPATISSILCQSSPAGGYSRIKSVVSSCVQKFFSHSKHTDLRAENFVLVPGSDAAYDMLAFALFAPGDVVLCPTPFTGRMYNNFEERAQIELRSVPTTDMFNTRLNVQSFDTVLSEAASQGQIVRAISLIQSHNPLGAVFNWKEVIELCEWAYKNDLWILIDEIFIPSVGDHSVQGSILLATSLHEFNDRLVWMWSVDKDLCLPGLRFAVIHSQNEELQRALNRLEILQPCSPLVQSFMEILLSDHVWLEKFYETREITVSENRHYVTKYLKQIGVNYVDPRAGNSIFLNLRAFISENSFEEEEQLWKKFMTDAGFYLNPGMFMGSADAGWFQMVIPLSKTMLDQALIRLEAVLNNIQKAAPQCMLELHKEMDQPYSTLNDDYIAMNNPPISNEECEEEARRYEADMIEKLSGASAFDFSQPPEEVLTEGIAFGGDGVGADIDDMLIGEIEMPLLRSPPPFATPPRSPTAKLSEQRRSSFSEAFMDTGGSVNLEEIRKEMGILLEIQQTSSDNIQDFHEVPKSSIVKTVSTGGSIDSDVLAVVTSNQSTEESVGDYSPYGGQNMKELARTFEMEEHVKDTHKINETLHKDRSNHSSEYLQSDVSILDKNSSTGLESDISFDITSPWEEEKYPHLMSSALFEPSTTPTLSIDDEVLLNRIFGFSNNVNSEYGQTSHMEWNQTSNSEDLLSRVFAPFPKDQMEWKEFDENEHSENKNQGRGPIRGSLKNFDELNKAQRRIVLSRRIRWAADPSKESKKKLSAIREGSGENVVPEYQEEKRETKADTSEVPNHDYGDKTKDHMKFLTDFSFIEELVKSKHRTEAKKPFHGSEDILRDTEINKLQNLNRIRETAEELDEQPKTSEKFEANIPQNFVKEIEDSFLLESVFSILPADKTIIEVSEFEENQSNFTDNGPKSPNSLNTVNHVDTMEEEFMPLSDFPSMPKQLTVDIPLQIPEVFEEPQEYWEIIKSAKENTSDWTIQLNRNAQSDGSERIFDTMERVFLDAVFIGEDKVNDIHEEDEGRWSRSDSGLAAEDSIHTSSGSVIGEGHSPPLSNPECHHSDIHVTFNHNSPTDQIALSERPLESSTLKRPITSKPEIREASTVEDSGVFSDYAQIGVINLDIPLRLLMQGDDEDESEKVNKIEIQEDFPQREEQGYQQPRHDQPSILNELVKEAGLDTNKRNVQDTVDVEVTIAESEIDVKSQLSGIIFTTDDFREMVGKTAVTPSSQPCDESTENNNETLTWQPIESLEPEEFASETIVGNSLFANEEIKRTDSLRTQIDLPKLSSNFDEIGHYQRIPLEHSNAVDSYQLQYNESQLLSLLSEGAEFCPTPHKETKETVEGNEPSLSTQTCEINDAAEIQHQSTKSESGSAASSIPKWEPLENLGETWPPLDATETSSPPAQYYPIQNEECPKNSDADTKKFSEDLDAMERRLSTIAGGQKSTSQILVYEQVMRDPAHVIEEYNKRVAEREPDKSDKAALSSPVPLRPHSILEEISVVDLLFRRPDEKSITELIVTTAVEENATFALTAVLQKQESKNSEQAIFQAFDEIDRGISIVSLEKYPRQIIIDDPATDTHQKSENEECFERIFGDMEKSIQENIDTKLEHPSQLKEVILMHKAEELREIDFNPERKFKHTSAMEVVKSEKSPVCYENFDYSVNKVHIISYDSKEKTSVDGIADETTKAEKDAMSNMDQSAGHQDGLIQSDSEGSLETSASSAVDVRQDFFSEEVKPETEHDNQYPSITVQSSYPLYYSYARPPLISHAKIRHWKPTKVKSKASKSKWSTQPTPPRFVRPCCHVRTSPSTDGSQQLHHDLQTSTLRQPTFASEARAKTVVLEHTNITQITYVRNSNGTIFKDAAPGEMYTRASTSINTFTPDELFHAIHFADREATKKTLKDASDNKFADRSASKRKRKNTSPMHSQIKRAQTTTEENCYPEKRNEKSPVENASNVNLKEKFSELDKTVFREYEYLACKNPEHTTKEDHCDSNRLYSVMTSKSRTHTEGYMRASTFHAEIPPTAEPSVIAHQPRGASVTSRSLKKTPKDKSCPPNYVDSIVHPSKIIVTTRKDELGNTTDTITLRHTPGSDWLVSSLCQTHNYTPTYIERIPKKPKLSEKKT